MHYESIYMLQEKKHNTQEHCVVSVQRKCSLVYALAHTMYFANKIYFFFFFDNENKEIQSERVYHDLFTFD